MNGRGYRIEAYVGKVICSPGAVSEEEEMGRRSICILGSCRSKASEPHPAGRASPQGIAPAHPPTGEALLVQKRRHSSSDLAQAQQTDRGQGRPLQGGCAWCRWSPRSAARGGA